MKQRLALAAIGMALLLVFQTSPALAGQNTIKFYGKGTIDETSVSPQVMLRTLIDSDHATFIRTGVGGINVVRMNLAPSDTCIQTQDTMCFAGTITESNIDMHQAGDKLSITLDLANKKEIVTFDSGKIQGTTFTISLSKAQIKLDGPYVITLSQEGGFAGIQKTIHIDMSSKELTVNDQSIPLGDDSIKQLTKAIKKAEFFDLSDNNYQPVQGSADYFSYSLEISQGAFQRTITWTDTSENVPEKLFALQNQIQEIATQPIPVDVFDTIQGTMAKDFIITTPTFAFDGIQETLNVIDIRIMESYPEQYVVTLEFTSTHGGYGNRTDQIVTQALTPHTMEILIVEGEVLSAVTDGTWDELNNQYVLKAP